MLTADLHSNTFISPTKPLFKHVVRISFHLCANIDIAVKNGKQGNTASPLSQTLAFLFFFPSPALSVLLHHASLCLQEQYRNANLCNNLPPSLLHVLSDCFCVPTPTNGNYPTAFLIERKLSKVTEARRVHLQLLREIAPSSPHEICLTLAQ